MKRITLISLTMPTFNNVRAASALPYHLVLGAKWNGDCEVEVWSFNLNKIDAEGIRESERQLGVRIHVLPVPRWYRWMFKLHLVFLRVLFRYPLLSYFKLDDGTIKQVEAFKPDIVWIYGEELAGLAAFFKGKKRIVTMPDCETMYYHRALTMNFLTEKLGQVLRYCFAYWQYRNMDRRNHALAASSKDNASTVTYHFVGKADAVFYQGINPSADAIFLRHPHYAWRDRQIKFHSPKIRLLFAGRYDFYCQHGSDTLLSAMLAATEDLKDKYEVTFLGKGWDNWCSRLSSAGWTAHVVAFAPDYIEELQKHDIQINAIDLGTGTKGKVLDAISNGLLAIGTPYALENIAVESGGSCIEYHSVDEAIGVLRDIPNNVDKYERMAEKGKLQVLKEHLRKKIAAELFGGDTKI